jgi:hypothetical protein
MAGHQAMMGTGQKVSIKPLSNFFVAAIQFLGTDDTWMTLSETTDWLGCE